MRRIAVPIAAAAVAAAVAVPALAHDDKGGKGHKPPSSSPAGTVQSFADGTLTVALAAGGTASGKVTDRTLVLCVPGPPAPAGTSPSQKRGRHVRFTGGHRKGWKGPRRGRCDAAANLTAGTTVRKATLALTSEGATFGKVVLAKAPATP
jgi:hypothetical protein